MRSVHTTSGRTRGAQRLTESRPTAASAFVTKMKGARARRMPTFFAWYSRSLTAGFSQIRSWVGAGTTYARSWGNRSVRRGDRSSRSAGGFHSTNTTSLTR
jgi:hypothetical protein